jgi:alkanesulfonate monooxygenase SsuD/methylene tetrahydromethanopterin reductase-like flavin-dependent oxidoreductase (luciferase family)
VPTPAEFYLFLPQMRMGFDVIVEKAIAAERAGFTGIALMDHLVPPLAEQHSMHEAFITAAAISAQTHSLRVGHLVLCDSFRHPAVLAREALALNHLSDGRFDLGIGTGSVLAEFETFGVPLLPGPARVRRLEETLQVLRALWSGQIVDFEGEFHQLDAASMAPRPVGQLPIVVGGSGPAMMGVISRHADWWNLPVHKLGLFEKIRPLAGSARVSMQQMVALVDEEANRDAIADLAHRRFPGQGMGLIVGTGDELREHFAGLGRRGVERFYVWFADFAPEPTVRLFGDRVVAPLG